MLLEEKKIRLAYREPFAFGAPAYVDTRPFGETLGDMVRSVPHLPADFDQRGFVCINGEVVPPPMWNRVRPKWRPDRPVVVTLHVTLHGGGSGGASTGKQIGLLVGAIALALVTYGVGSGLLFAEAGAAVGSALGVSAAAGSSILGGAIGIAGALALSALSPPPTAAAGVDPGTTNAEQAEAAAASGNILDRLGSIPRVIGTRKVFPPLACEPVVELVDQDEVVEALYVLNGPHLLDDIRIDGSPIIEAEDVDFDTREGWPSDSLQTMIQRTGRTISPQLQLSDASVQGDGQLLSHQSLPETDLSVWHGVSSKTAPDEIWAHFLFPGGIYPGSNTYASVPLRVRIRKRGDANWTNLPELFYSFNSSNQRRAAILFKWQTPDPQVAPPVNTTAGFVYAHLSPPGSNNTPPTPPERMWAASSYFDNGTGTDAWLTSTNLGTTRVRNINLFDNRAEIYLDAATFPKGIYEVQFKRGTILITATLNITSYAYTGFGQPVDWFWYFNSGGSRIFVTHANVSDNVALTRLVSIWHEKPITSPGEHALIVIKALNRSVRQLSTKASGYVQDWDGSDWTTWTTTSNPAPHYRDVLSGELNLDPLPSDLRDDAGLVAWRTLAVNNDWTCDLIVNDTRTQDVLNSIASCAYARPYQSDIYGVTVDNDRSADAPVQVFSRRNTANLFYEKAFPRLPAGFNVTYRDEASDDDQAQVTIYQRDPSNIDLTLLESVAYDGLIDVDKVTQRAQFDLDQASARSTFYNLRVDLESIVCRRGSLVGIEHDVLTVRSGDGYIASKQVTAGNLVGVTLDDTIATTNELDMHNVANMHTVADMHTVGVQTGIAIRRTDGTLSTHPLSNATGSSNVLTFATPIPDVATIQGYADNDRKYGCMVVAGDMTAIYKRMLVQSITPDAKDLTATMVLVDEAPQLVRSAGQKMLLAMDNLTPLKTMAGTAEPLESMK